MTLLRCILRATVLALTLGVSLPLIAQQPGQTQEPLQEFVPLEDLPATEQLPAAPLVIAAYSFVWLALFFYVVSVARRLATVQREVERLETDMNKRKGN